MLRNFKPFNHTFPFILLGFKFPSLQKQTNPRRSIGTTISNQKQQNKDKMLNQKEHIKTRTTCAKSSYIQSIIGIFIFNNKQRKE